MTEIRKMSVRSGRVWHALSDDVTITSPSGYLDNVDNFTILIHGFNNSEDAASSSYAKFRKQFEKALRADAGPTFGPIWEFHWPGNLKEKIISKLSFNARIPVAESAGKLLAQCLFERVRPGNHVTLIAHSLGCLVALETLRALIHLEPTLPRISRIIMLAAAVPVEMCAPDDPDYPPDQRVRELVMFSLNDWTLKRPYPAGSKMYYGRSAQAVGRLGTPHRRWHATMDTGLDHGDYWGSPWMGQQVAIEFGAAEYRYLNTWNVSINVLPSVTIESKDLPSYKTGG